MVIFRYGAVLTLAIINRRPNLSDTIVWTVLSCQDFLSGVKYGLSTLLQD